jgi:hypothetical protein
MSNTSFHRGNMADASPPASISQQIMDGHYNFEGASEP